MRKQYRQGGYSNRIAEENVSNEQPIYVLSTELRPQRVYEDGKPTKEISGYKAWFTQEGLPPFEVKFETEIKLPSYLTPIAFNNLQACEVNYNIYFKADDLNVVK